MSRSCSQGTEVTIVTGDVLFCVASFLWVWKCPHNNRPFFLIIGRILKSLCQELYMFDILLKIQRLVYPDKLSLSQF